MTRHEAIEYVRENTMCGWLSNDTIDDSDTKDAIIALLGSPKPSGYMAEESGWRVHPSKDSFDDDERALAGALAELEAREPGGQFDQIVTIKTRSVDHGACFASVILNGEKIYETPAFAYGANHAAYVWAQGWCEDNGYQVEAAE